MDETLATPCWSRAQNDKEDVLMDETLVVS